MTMAHVPYNPETGEFITKRKGVWKGYLRPDGYLEIRIKGKVQLCHRLAWIISHGTIPEGMVVDHINRNRADNRLRNLRLLSHKNSQWNRSDRFNCKQQGVRKRGRRWEAYMAINGKVSYLGMHDTEDLAILARKAAERSHWHEML